MIITLLNRWSGEKRRGEGDMFCVVGFWRFERGLRKPLLWFYIQEEEEEEEKLRAEKGDIK